MSSKLLITEITYMGALFCVIGLQRNEAEIRSIRPVAPNFYGWRYFPYRRGDVLQCDLAQVCAAAPHLEDRLCSTCFEKKATIAEAETVAYLRRAEYADSLQELFGCAVHENRRGSGLYAKPASAKRSICGTEPSNIRLELCGGELRATLALDCGEVLRDLPVVDRDWLDFVRGALAPPRGPSRQAHLERFLNSQFHCKILSCPHRYVRLGLTRPYKDVCWVMLDTLFPLPTAEWLQDC